MPSLLPLHTHHLHTRCNRGWRKNKTSAFVHYTLILYAYKIIDLCTLTLDSNIHTKTKKNDSAFPHHTCSLYVFGDLTLDPKITFARQTCFLYIFGDIHGLMLQMTKLISAPLDRKAARQLQSHWIRNKHQSLTKSNENTIFHDSLAEYRLLLIMRKQ
jgi:hypothetical protein